MAIKVLQRTKFILVELFLLGTHLYTEDLFHLGGQRFFHIFLDTSEEEGLKDFVKALISIFSAFPMLVLKILPGLKPAVDKRRNSNSQ